ncbi:STE/STE11/cdc15 protein kinase [Rhodotorula diobovata]|uniref:Small ribosomal subunit protein bS18m n=1 Tax=Rhodotorula diobovata TaxID=5288 RepID=A0A5C5FWJ2_9BASI|nr:STE/STE11/cdc15 protein kinase [Rhodotorula diobovata]
MFRTSLQSTARTAQATPACSAWRARFSCAAVRAAPPPPPAGASSPGQKAPAPGTDALVELLEDVGESSPGAAQELQSQTSVLRHLSRNQVISPQHLSPRHLLVPYQPRPNFALAHPLGPPTSFAETHDPFVRYGLDPLRDAATNPFVLSEFVTSMGKIKSRGKTGLQRKSQRRVGKAVRRARSMGIIPTFGISVPGAGGQY